MKNINLYLVAFYVTLAKSLVFTMSGWEFGLMTALLIKLGFDAYMEANLTKDDFEPLKLEIKKIGEKVSQVENSVKLIKFNQK